MTDKVKTSAKIRWAGGPCPVDGEPRVYVAFRDEIEAKIAPAKAWRWEHENSSDDIVAYKTVLE